MCSVRLSKNTIDTIKQITSEVFGKGDIYLFGSRVDLNKKGGDIDLYCVPSQSFSSDILVNKRLEFLVKLKKRIGDQKIDLIIAEDSNRSIEQQALKEGVKL